jgi:ABC-type sugar transport system ATPase subunit
MRPRSVSLASEAGPHAFTARAELIEPMGAETLIHARTTEGDDIRVVVPRERRVAVGEVVHLAPEPGQTHVFDGDGEAVRS